MLVRLPKSVSIFFDFARPSLFVGFLYFFGHYCDFSVNSMAIVSVLAPFIDPCTVCTHRPWSASSASAGVTNSPVMTSSEGMARIAVLLLENGANVDAQDSAGR